MFYEGDLQSGIGVAIQEAKVVACLVCDDGVESGKWEQEYLDDRDQIAATMHDAAILLRIEHGSQEARFLADVCPYSTPPALIIIQNGQLRDHLESGITKDQFKDRLLMAVKHVPRDELSQHPPPDRAREQEGPPMPRAVTPGGENAPPMVHRSSATQSPPFSAPLSTGNASDNTSAQSRPPPGDAGGDRAKSSRQVDWARAQRERESDARNERERIRRRIADDRAEQRERDKASRREKGGHGSSNVKVSESPQTGTTDRPSKRDCAIQVRLFDGSTLRRRFPPDSTLRTDVRSWVNGLREDRDIPFTFTQMLTPMPNRSISISEEEESLEGLGLRPSATLVLVPIRTYTEAYGGHTGSFLTRGAAAGYGVLSAGLGMVSGALGQFLGTGNATPTGEESGRTVEGERRREHAQEPPTATRSGINVRTLRDQNGGGEGQEYYNGNQVGLGLFVDGLLNFEPNPDHDTNRR
ncbi:MAG: hypothetical protein M1833_007008 [Piccolia ochrophora]|nr:MAG: hypothetical protein M1833_007008 [Piccolia ochrophora]